VALTMAWSGLRRPPSAWALLPRSLGPSTSAAGSSRAASRRRALSLARGALPSPSFWRHPGVQCLGSRARDDGYRASGSTRTYATGRQIDPPTVELHQKYHDETIEYTAKNIEWVQSKAYGIDAALQQEEQAAIWHAARRRLQRWPQLDDRDMHKVLLGRSPQRFCASSHGEDLGDPRQNVFVVSLPRRPTRLRHALQQLNAQKVSATVVDAVDGDAILCKEDLARHSIAALPGYCGHKNHNIELTTGEVGCFMSHFTIWHHMVENQIPAALILEDDFDFQQDFGQRLGEYLEEARGEDWNLMFVGRSPMEADWRRVSEHVVEPGYTLWTVGYILRLDAAQALLDAKVETQLAPLDDFFTLAMGRGRDQVYNDKALEWLPYIPQVIRPLALTPPLVMPYVGSLFLSDTAMLRKGTRYVKDLPDTVSIEKPP